MSRRAFIRSLLREPPRERDHHEVASREEALSILTGLALDGRVAAAIALEHALREDGEPHPWAELGVERRQQ